MSRILIVDDSETMRRIIMRTLRMAGIRSESVLQASDGIEALDQLASHSDVSLVLCDLNMPNMNGVELIRKIRETTPPKTLPIIVISTEGGEDMRALALKEGANDYVSKPFKTETVLTKVGRYLGCEIPKPAELLETLKVATNEVFTSMVSTVAVLVECRESDSSTKTISDTEDTVDIEAVVEFSGRESGAVVLRCSTGGAMDITRGLLMLREDESVELDEIEDALGECANMVCGSVKAKALDTVGEFKLSIPKIESYSNKESNECCGTLVYRLQAGCVAIEIWIHSSETLTTAAGN